MKIVILHPSLDVRGGAERKILLLYRYLRDKNIDVDLYTHKVEKEKTFGHLLDNKIKILPEICRVNKIIEFFMTGFILRKYDVIIASNYPANISSVISKLFSKKKVHWICNEVAVLLIRRNSLVWNIYYYLEKLLVKKIDDVIVNSNNTKAIFESYYKKNARVVYSGLDIEFLKNLKLTPRENVEIESNKYIFVMSRIEKHKNLNFIEEICLFLKNHYPSMKVVVAGAGTEENLVRNIEQTNNNCIYLGAISEEEKAYYYQNAKVFAFLPKNEPLGVTILESLYYGTLVVSFNSGGPKEIIGNSLYGFLCNTESEYLNKLLNCINNQVSEERKNEMRRYIENKFSVESMVGGFLKNIDNIN